MEQVQILENKQFNGIELYFNTKPQINTITALKNNNFRWHTAKKCWYAKASEQNKAFALSLTNLQDITEIAQQTAENTKNDFDSELKYLLNGIKDKNGNYFKVWYDFDYITYSIHIHHENYRDLPTPSNMQGIIYKDDTDIMTDYFCKPSMTITPQSAEYLTAFDNLIRLQDKGKNYHFTLTDEIITTAKKLARAFYVDYDKALNDYNSKVAENEKAIKEQEEQQRIKAVKTTIENLQNYNGSYYSNIYENEKTITATSVSQFSTIDFVKGGLTGLQTEYTARTINKTTFEDKIEIFTSEEDLNNYINNLYNK